MTAGPAVVTAGLTDDEVARRVAAGQSNDVPTRAARTTGEIVRANVFTRINAILGVLFVIVLSTGSVINGAFGLLIVANSAIGIIQELRAKRTLDKLAIVGQAKPLVRRRSGTRGRWPPARWCSTTSSSWDPATRSSSTARWSRTTISRSTSPYDGEADPIAKDAADPVMSGSFVVAGSGAYRATKVGREAYAAKLAEEASKFTLVKSELRSGINQILRFITYLLVPAGLLTIYTQLFTTDTGWRRAVLAMVGALVPMVPEGLVLMTSIAFAVGVIRLGRRQCLVNELPAIEGLARVDVVCADKTGTLTENGMRLSDVETFTADHVEDVLASMAADDSRPNASMQAIAEAYRARTGLDRDRGRAVQIVHQVERGVLRRARQLADRCAGRAARPVLARRRTGRGNRIPRPARPAGGLIRCAGGRSGRSGHGDPGRARRARTTRAARRP